MRVANLGQNDCQIMSSIMHELIEIKGLQTLCCHTFCYSFWDVRSVECVKELPLPGPVYDIELNRSLAQLTVAHCNGVTFVDPLK